jgi:hypothetical protein
MTGATWSSEIKSPRRGLVVAAIVSRIQPALPFSWVARRKWCRCPLGFGLAGGWSRRFNLARKA